MLLYPTVVVGWSGRVCACGLGRYKIFDEILVNAADHKTRNPKEVTAVKVRVDLETAEISVWNDGPGIEVAIHKAWDEYVRFIVGLRGVVCWLVRACVCVWAQGRLLLLGASRCEITCCGSLLPCCLLVQLLPTNVAKLAWLRCWVSMVVGLWQVRGARYFRQLAHQQQLQRRRAEVDGRSQRVRRQAHQCVLPIFQSGDVRRGHEAAIQASLAQQHDGSQRTYHFANEGTRIRSGTDTERAMRAPGTPVSISRLREHAQSGHQLTHPYDVVVCSLLVLLSLLPNSRARAPRALRKLPTPQTWPDLVRNQAKPKTKPNQTKPNQTKQRCISWRRRS